MCVKPREIIKNITVLMPCRSARGDTGGSKEIVITADEQSIEEPLIKQRMCILKYKEIEYIITKRIRSLSLTDALDRPVVNLLTVDHLVTGSGLEGANQDKVKNSDIIIAYIGNSTYFSDSVNVIYEMALRNVLRPELILLGELESEELLKERVGFYLSQYTLLNVERSRDDEIVDKAIAVARNTRDYPLHGYGEPIPEVLRLAIDRGADLPLEEGLRTRITTVIKDPPQPPYMTRLIEQLDPHKLVSTSVCYLPSSVVRVTFAPKSSEQDKYTPEQLIDITTCDYNAEFEDLYGFRRRAPRLDDDFLFAQLKGFVKTADLNEFIRDQEVLFESIVYRPGVGTASVPLRIDERHPLPAYRNTEYLPSTILRKQIGDLRFVHSYLLLVVYFEVGRWRQKIKELVQRPKRLQAVPTVCDEDLVKYTLGLDPVPRGWDGRALYLGEDGARAWLQITSDPSYALRDDSAFQLRQMRGEALEQLRLETETLVSFGPGDGELDLDIVEALTDRLTKVRYIPVEISSGLLTLSVQKLKGHVDIPVAILGDFESGQRFVARALSDYACRPKPILFSLIGGTLGNLDRAGSLFLKDVTQLMQPGDGLFLDVPLAGPAWEAASDSRMLKAEFSQPFRQFLAGGVARQDPSASAAAYESWFDERIECVCAPSRDIEGTQVITIRDRSTGHTLLRFNRYNWDTLGSWLKGHGFDVRYAENSLQSPRDSFGMGVLLLERSPVKPAGGAEHGSDPQGRR